LFARIWVTGILCDVILVVGGAGYIGSHMLSLLRDQEYPHLVFDNLEKGHRGALQGSKLIIGDLRSAHDLEQVFRDHPEIDAVMHFAAYTYVGESVTEPAKYWENNTTGVLTILDTMRKFGIKNFVFSSTCATFGNPQYLPLDENHPQNPINPYGQTKLAVERILADYDVAYGLKSVILRYFNAAGADPEGRIGEDHRPEAHLIPLAIYAAQGKTPPLKVFGNDYDTPDGTCVRDYIHVLDLASAHLLAIDHLRSGGESRAYNLGNGQGFSVKEVIDVVSEVTGQTVPFVLADRRPGDPPRLVGTSEKIRNDWGWSPAYADLRTIVGHAWNWHRTHPDGYMD
jgi:UDP-glucose 4-epimerase